MGRSARRSALRFLPCLALQVLVVARQEILLPYTPQLPEKCQDHKKEHYVEAINKCCSLCPPGSRVLRSCSETADTQCVPCEEGMYTTVWSRAERCLGCIPPCKAGYVEVRECNVTQDRRCWCQTHQFCSLRRKETCLQCVNLQTCRRGYGVVKPGTENSDAQCAPCGPGTFSDVDSPSAGCKPHTPCKSVLVPGNSTSDNVCGDLHRPDHFVTISPHTFGTGRGHLPPRSFTTNIPVLEVKVDPSTDISAVTGWAAGTMFAIFALISGTLLCFAFRNKGQPCASPCGKEKQPFPSMEKCPGNRPRDASSLGQEDQNLLEMSTSSSSGSLDHPSTSEKSSRISNGSIPNVGSEEIQQRSHFLDSCMSHNIANSKQLSNGSTRLNVSCVVSVCNSDHEAPFRSPNGSLPAVHTDCSSANDGLPFPKEESPVRKESGRQIAVEVEDYVDMFDDLEGKLLPLSMQDTGMKTA